MHTLMGQEDVEDAVDVFLEGVLGLLLLLAFEVEQDDALGTALGDILVLALLSVGEAVALLKHLLEVGRVGFRVPRANDTDATCREESVSTPVQLVISL